MPLFKPFPQWIRNTRFVASSFAAAALAACGGGQSDTTPSVAATPVSTSTLSFQLTQPDTTASTEASALQLPAGVSAEPTFHVAPVELEAPDDADVLDPSASARRAAHTATVPDGLSSLKSRGLTLQDIQSARRARAAAAAGSGESPAAAAPLASPSVVATYTPAQVRAAYGLPALPSSYSGLSAAQAAQLGAGQTIYIVNAFHNPNVVAELNAFNQRFGLPSCATQSIAPTSALPLAAASAAAGCVLSVVYSNAAGAMTSAAPAYNNSWATEIALDVQWAHATAPLARIILIEASDASNGLTNAIGLAGRMGPGVVSMSFGAAEGSWMASVDSVFTGTGMTYLAATGDSGYGVSWPAASAKVLAVGGTSLNYSGSGARSEAAWSGSGGGVSAYVATPSYQTNQVPGLGSAVRRTVPDVAFNANPSTGQYVAVMAPGSTAVSWISAGGTSLSTPQWAGIVAIANAMRAQSARAVLGLVQPTLYSQIASVPGTYASNFLDVVTGTNGTCAICAAKTGHDVVTGIGTPHVSSLLTTLSGATVTTAPVAPSVTAASVSGKVGTALSYTVGYTAPNAVTLALSGAPSGMTISNTGVLSWATPVAGTYSVTVSAKDSKTTLTGSAVLSISISAASSTASGGPTITASAFKGVAGKALTGTITIANPGATGMSISITGVPAGVSISPKGLVLTLNWAKPVTGSYTMTVSVADNLGRSARQSVPITITAK